MNQVRRALASTLIAALVVPTVAAAQEPSRPVNGTAATEAGALGEVRLTFEGQRSSNPWAVFGGGQALERHAPPGGPVSRPAARGSVGGPTRLANIEAAARAQGRIAARRGMAGQSQSWQDWWIDRRGLLLIAIVAGVIAAPGHRPRRPHHVAVVVPATGQRLPGWRDRGRPPAYFAMAGSPVAYSESIPSAREARACHRRSPDGDPEGARTPVRPGLPHVPHEDHAGGLRAHRLQPPPRAALAEPVAGVAELDDTAAVGLDAGHDRPSTDVTRPDGLRAGGRERPHVRSDVWE